MIEKRKHKMSTRIKITKMPESGSHWGGTAGWNRLQGGTGYKWNRNRVEQLRKMSLFRDISEKHYKVVSGRKQGVEQGGTEKSYTSYETLGHARRS